PASLRAQALFYLAELERETGDEGFRAHYERAIWAADEAEDDELRADALCELAARVAYHEEDRAAGDRLLAAATAAVHRARSPRLDVQLGLVQSAVAMVRGDLKAAFEHGERALTTAEHAFGPHDRGVARALGNLVTLLIATGELARAAEYAKRS